MLRARRGHGRRGSPVLQRAGDGHKLNRRVRPVRDDHLHRRQAVAGGAAARPWPRPCGRLLGFLCGRIEGVRLERLHELSDRPAVMLRQLDEDTHIHRGRRSTGNDTEHLPARHAVWLAHAARTPTRVASSRSFGLVVRRSRCSSSTTSRWTTGWEWTSWAPAHSLPRPASQCRNAAAWPWHPPKDRQRDARPQPRSASPWIYTRTSRLPCSRRRCVPSTGCLAVSLAVRKERPSTRTQAHAPVAQWIEQRTSNP
jgi:hypothetical protein